MSAVAAIVVAAVLTVAAGAKLRNRADAEADFTALGLPTPGLLTIVVPATELTVAIGLVVRPAAFGFVAAALLTAFTVVLLRARRAKLTCSCFGSLGRGPVSGGTVARNGLLIALALTASIAPDPEILVAVSTPALVATVVGQMFVLRQRVGHLWSTELAGEIR